MMRNSKLHEFYAPLKRVTDEGSTIHWIVFDVDECDECGCEMMAPNSMHLSAPIAGQLRWPTFKSLPDEGGGHCDALDGTVCGACWVA